MRPLTAARPCTSSAPISAAIDMAVPPPVTRNAPRQPLVRSFGGEGETSPSPNEPGLAERAAEDLTAAALQLDAQPVAVGADAQQVVAERKQRIGRGFAAFAAANDEVERLAAAGFRVALLA